MDDEIAKWANENKKTIAREYIRNSDFKSKDNPTGIFMAGLPGAGKTEFTVELIKYIADAPLRIDMDEIAKEIEGYKPQIAARFRKGASTILGKIYDETVKKKIDFVLDGTFSHSRALENIQRAIDHNYKVKIYYIHQSPEVAWQFTKDRELIEHRGIDRQGFIETYIKLHQNLIDLCKDYKDVTISLIVKDYENKEGRRVEDVKNLFDELPEFLNAEQLESVLK
jgi:UDP-N-acetylglucosamine kinase